MRLAVTALAELDEAEGAEAHLARIDGRGRRRGCGGGEITERDAEQVADIAASRNTPRGRLGAQPARQAQREANSEGARGVLGLPPAPRGQLRVVVGTRRRPSR